MSDNIATAPSGTRVRLSDGSEFYVGDEASIADVVVALDPSIAGFVLIGEREVNPAQVTQLTWEVIPSLAEVEVLDVPEIEPPS